MSTITTPLPAHSNHRGPTVLVTLVAVVAVGFAAWAFNGLGSNNPPAQPANTTSSAVPNELSVHEELELIRGGSANVNSTSTKLTMDEEITAISQSFRQSGVGTAPTEVTAQEEVNMIRAGGTKAIASTTEYSVAEELQAIRVGGAKANFVPTMAEEVQMIRDSSGQ